jgi:hypothetical protein
VRIGLRPTALKEQVVAKATLAVTVTLPPLAGTTLRDALRERMTGRFDPDAPFARSVSTLPRRRTPQPG